MTLTAIQHRAVLSFVFLSIVIGGPLLYYGLHIPAVLVLTICAACILVASDDRFGAMVEYKTEELLDDWTLNDSREFDD